MTEDISYNPWTEKLDWNGIDLATLNGLFLKIDQTTPQTVINGTPIFQRSITVQNNAGTEYSLFGTAAASLTLAAATDSLVGSKTGDLASANIRALIGVGEFNSNSNSGYAAMGINGFAYSAATAAGNLTASTSGGGLRNRYTVQHNGSGTVTQASAVSGLITNATTGGAITDSAVFHAESPTCRATTTWTSHSGLWVRGGAVGGTITTRYGVRVDTLTGGSTLWGLYLQTNNAYVGGKIGANQLVPVYRIDADGTVATDGIRSSMGFDIYQVPTPTTPTGVVSAGGAVDTGDHYYYITYTTALGATGSRVSAKITTTGGNNTVTLTIPVSTDPRVTGRRISRTKAGAASVLDFQHPLGTIANNVDVTWVDTTADADLLGAVYYQYFQSNTTTQYISINGTRSAILDPYLVSFGPQAGAAVTTGGRNSFFGYQAGVAVTTGVDNNFFGFTAGSHVNTGQQNIAIGYSALPSLTQGSANTIIGHDGDLYNQTGNYNTAVGAFALFGTSTNSHSNNTAVGYYAGAGVTTGGSGVFLGAFAGKYETVGSKLFIDSIDRGTEARGRVESLIYGVMSATLANQLLYLGGGGTTNILGKSAEQSTTVTVANGATTFAVASNFVTVTGDAGGNTVATITGGVTGMTLVMLFVDTKVAITDTAAATANTVNLSAAFTSAANTTLTLIYDGNKWFETARSVN